jgi:hypothetical protein
MGIYEHATQFAGLPVVDWEPGRRLRNPDRTAYRLSLDFEETEAGAQWSDRLASFLEDPASGQVRAIVVGIWGGESYVLANSSAVVEALVAARDRLPNLRGLFLGDIIQEENEISWIEQSDISPLFHAYPTLEHFRVRGTQNLTLGTLQHDHLKSLTIESGGLPVAIVHDVAAAQLPALEHLELWLGTPDYGGDATVEDLAPILSGRFFPKLRYLGLRDSEIADEVAAAVAGAPVLDRIRVLDLSLGTLTDEGAAALLASPAVAHLEKLDIHHHYCSQQMVERLHGLGIDLDAGDPQQAEEHRGEVWRYVAVGE